LVSFFGGTTQSEEPKNVSFQREKPIASRGGGGGSVFAAKKKMWVTVKSTGIKAHEVSKNLPVWRNEKANRKNGGDTASGVGSRRRHRKKKSWGGSGKNLKNWIRPKETNGKRKGAVGTVHVEPGI